jgi:hypothetical protein
MSFLVELPQSEYNPNAFKGFNPTVGFDNGNALAMAWMAQLAYETRLPNKVGAIKSAVPTYRRADGAAGCQQ